MRSIKQWFIAGIAAFVAAALVVAGLLVTRGLDLTDYRPQITAQMEAATGRTFEIGEDLKLGFRRGLVIWAHDVKMGNADWGSEPIMIRLKHAELRPALYPLLQGELQIDHIAFEGPHLLLETDESGRGNWELEIGGDEGDTGFDVASISIQSGSVEWRDTSSSEGESITVSNISLKAEDDGVSLALVADARISDEPFQLEGHLASPTTWKHGLPPHLNVRLDSEVGEVHLEGTVETKAQGVIPRLSLSAKALDLAMLAKFAGQDAPQLPAVDVALALTRLNEAWNIDIHKAEAGSSDLSGSIQFEGTADRPRVSGSLTAKRIGFDELLSRPVETSKANISDRGVFSPKPIDLAFLHALEIDLELRAEELGTTKQNFKNAELEIEVQRSQLQLRTHGESFEGKGKFRGTLFVDGDERAPSWSMNLALTQYPASALQRAAAITAIDAPVDLTLDIRTRGVSPRQMAERLSGNARIVAGQGRVRLKTVDNFVGGLSTVAGQLFEEGTNDTQLNCVVGDLRVKEGVVTTQVALIDTEASTLRIDGKVDLGREKIDLTVSPRPKKPTLTVAVPVHVEGGLQDPEFEPDHTSLLGKLIGVGSLLVYPPAAIVALGDLGDSGKSCAEMINAPGALQEKKGSPVRNVAESIGDAASAIGLGIKRLFGD